MSIFFIILCFIWFLSEIILSRLMRVTDSGKNEDKSTLKIIWITIFVSISAGIFLSNTDLIITKEYTVFIFYSGIFLIIGGLVVRWISIIKLKKSFTVHVTTSADQHIEQSGIYKYIRHPSYLGSLLSFSGLAIFFNNWLSILCIFFPVFLAFYYRIYIEEKLLTKVFGHNYQVYIKNTGKLFPKIF